MDSSQLSDAWNKFAFRRFRKKIRKKYYLFRFSVQFLHVVKYLHNKTKQCKTFDYLITQVINVLIETTVREHNNRNAFSPYQTNPTENVIRFLLLAILRTESFPCKFYKVDWLHISEQYFCVSRLRILWKIILYPI